MDLLADLSSAEALSDNPVMFDSGDLVSLVIRFLINAVVVGIIIHFFYYPKSRNHDYYFTFLLISVSVFFLTYLLGSVKLKIGFALGIFAIFGIIRYRTESVRIREMTYLFVIIAISVINALGVQISIGELAATNILFILSVWLLESERWLKRISCKLILYDRIQLITPDRREELIADLEKRTGLHIIKVEIGQIDFLKDAAFIKIYFKDDSREINDIQFMRHLPREDE